MCELEMKSYKRATFYDENGCNKMYTDIKPPHQYKMLELSDVTVEFDDNFINVHGYDIERHYNNPDNMFGYDIEKRKEEYCIKDSDYEYYTTLFLRKVKKRLKIKFYTLKEYKEHFLSFTNLTIIETK